MLFHLNNSSFRLELYNSAAVSAQSQWLANLNIAN